MGWLTDARSNIFSWISVLSSLTCDLAWMLMFQLRNGGVLGTSRPWLLGLGRWLKGQMRLGSASTLLPPLLPTQTNSPVSALPTGLLDRILFEEQIWKFREPAVWIPSSSDAAIFSDQTANWWHVQAFYTRCPLGQQWQGLTHQGGTWGPKWNGRHPLNRNWRLKETQSFLIFRF